MRFFRDVTITAIAIGLMLLVLEGGFRLAGIRFEASLYTPEQERGFASRPGAEGWSTDENDVYVRINSDGMRDRERSVIAPPNTLRIAAIGSSEVDGRQVSLDDTFEAIMERELTRDLKSRCHGVEVLNFGVPSYSLAQEYLTLSNHVWKYHPQIIILATKSDVMIRNTRKLTPDAVMGTPFYTLDRGNLVPGPETRSTPPLNIQRVKWKNRLSDCMNRSELLMLGNEALRIKGPEVLSRIKPQFSTKASAIGSRPDMAPLVYAPELPETQESWRIGEAFLERMQQDCQRHAAEFWIVVLDMPVAVHPDLSARAALAKRLGLNTLEASDERIAAFGKARRIHTLLLAPEMGRYAESHHVALHGFANTAFGHWNEIGHRVAARLITEELLRSSAVISKLNQFEQGDASHERVPVCRRN